MNWYGKIDIDVDDIKIKVKFDLDFSKGEKTVV